MPQQSSILASDLFVYVMIVIGVCMSGVYMFASIPYSDVLNLVADTIEFSKINKKEAINIAKQLPDVMNIRLIFVYLYAKAFMYVKMLLIVFYGYLVGNIDIKSQIASTVSPIIPSTGAYHLARRLIVMGFVILPCVYIVMPIDYYMKIGMDNTRYIFAITNGLLIYYATKMFIKNRPKVL